MDDKRSFSPPMVGGSSLLAIFAVLCLTIFALLSLSTVLADSRLGDASAQAVCAYYEADCRAEEILARIRAGEIPDGIIMSFTGAGSVYSYSCPISDTQTLVVEVRVDGPDDYEILRWQAVSTAEWAPDDHLEVWDGDEEEFTPFF